MSAAVPAPFVVRWETTSSGPGHFEARLALTQTELFEGHYPGAPILPGTYLVEALVQAVRAHSEGSLKLAEIESCRFRAPMGPGDSIAAAFELEPQPTGRLRVRATAKTAKGEAASATLVLVDAAAAAPGEAKATHVRSGSPEPGAEADGLARAGADVRGPGAEPRAPASGVHAGDPSPAGRLLDHAFIRKVLPHRFPALLVDSARFFEGDASGQLLIARKAVSSSEPCYAAYASASALSWRYPETLIAESFCQSCGLLRAASPAPGPAAAGEGKIPVVARLSGFRFFAEVAPGECLEHRVRLLSSPLGGAMFSGETISAGRLVAKVEKVVAVMAQRGEGGPGH